MSFFILFHPAELRDSLCPQFRKLLVNFSSQIAYYTFLLSTAFVAPIIQILKSYNICFFPYLKDPLEEVKWKRFITFKESWHFKRNDGNQKTMDGKLCAGRKIKFDILVFYTPWNTLWKWRLNKGGFREKCRWKTKWHDK